MVIESMTEKVLSYVFSNKADIPTTPNRHKKSIVIPMLFFGIKANLIT